MEWHKLNRKRNFVFLVLFISSCITNAAPFSFKPLATLSFGLDATNSNLNQNVSLLPPFENIYVSNGRDNEFVAGILLGFETNILTNLLAQLGISYFQSGDFSINGTVFQLADPARNNLNYHYSINSQRILADGKVLLLVKEKYYPFISIGIGEAINKSYNYTETPVNTNNVPMFVGFANHTNHSFTYEAGAGIEVDVMQHIRWGFAYRFVNLGQAALGTTPIQIGTQTLAFNNFQVNEFLMQISYVG